MVLSNLRERKEGRPVTLVFLGASKFHSAQHFSICATYPWKRVCMLHWRILQPNVPWEWYRRNSSFIPRTVRPFLGPRFYASSSPPFLPPTGDPRYDLVEDEEKEGVRNYLVIHDADEEDFGAYNCSVVNEYGVAQMLIRLKQESEWMTSWLLLQLEAQCMQTPQIYTLHPFLNLVFSKLGECFKALLLLQCFWSGLN